MSNLLLILAGIALLAIGGEVLIRGAVGLGRRLGVSPLLSGLVIVGFGTSAPELVVSLDAALKGQPDIAVGNVVGSNIGNVLLILGLSALISPIVVHPLALRRDALVVLAASGLFMVLALGGALSRWEGLGFLVALLAYLALAYWTERRPASATAELYQAEAAHHERVPQSVPWMVAAVLVGLALLIGGSRLLLAGAVAVAEQLGVSAAVIGLTLVAVGTSLPELSVALVAALRRQADVAVGNVLGSNIFNLLGILGLSAFVQPLPVHARILQFDQWVLVGTAVLVLLLLYTGRRLSRFEGAVLLLGYVAYAWLSFTVFAG